MPCIYQMLQLEYPRLIKSPNNSIDTTESRSVVDQEDLKQAVSHEIKTDDILFELGNQIWFKVVTTLWLMENAILVKNHSKQNIQNLSS